jgi:N6-L-threonylcarbamoyladenine synthase
VVDVLVKKTMRAAEKYKAKTIALSGGVAANKKLRGDLAAAAAHNKMQFTVPDFSLCTDNAGMIAIAAYFNLRGGKKPVPFSKVKADSSWELK